MEKNDANELSDEFFELIYKFKQKMNPEQFATIILFNLFMVLLEVNPSEEALIGFCDECIENTIKIRKERK